MKKLTDKELFGDSSDIFPVENRIGLAVIIAVVAAGFISVWVLHSKFEAAAFNRVTGSHMTTWDAMWLQTRVQEAPR